MPIKSYLDTRRVKICSELPQKFAQCNIDSFQQMNFEKVLENG